MRLLTILKRLLGGLRNRPGGMAYINSSVSRSGAGADLVGRFVITRRVSDGDCWEIDPPQQYVARTDALDAGGNFMCAGCLYTCVTVRDRALTPIPDAKLSHKDVARLYEPAPAPTVVQPVKEKV
jgi:hypothetical protein